MSALIIKAQINKQELQFMMWMTNLSKFPEGLPAGYELDHFEPPSTEFSIEFDGRGSIQVKQLNESTWEATYDGTHAMFFDQKALKKPVVTEIPLVTPPPPVQPQKGPDGKTTFTLTLGGYQPLHPVARREDLPMLVVFVVSIDLEKLEIIEAPNGHHEITGRELMYANRALHKFSPIFDMWRSQIAEFARQLNVQIS